MYLISEFVARWKKEKATPTVKQGKELTKEIAKNKGLNPTLEKKLLMLKDSREEWREVFKGTNNDEYYRHRPGYNGKPPSDGDLIKIRDRTKRQQRIKELSEKAKEKYNKRKVKPTYKSSIRKKYSSQSTSKPNYIRKSDMTGKSSITTEGMSRLKELREKASKKIPIVNASSAPISSTIISSNNSRQAFNQRLQSVGKSAMKKELLGATAIAGVIGGIALARKVRSDKNKKRGKYRRF